VPKGNLKSVTRNNRIMVSAVENAERALEFALQ